MSDHTSVQPPVTGLRDRVRDRIVKLRTSRQRSALGIAEVAGLAASALIAAAVVIAYFSFLVPARIRLERTQNERLQLQERIRAKTEGVKAGTDKESSLRQISESLTEFESNSLDMHTQGRLDLVTTLNDLFRENNVKNTSGPTFVGLEPLGENGKLAAGSVTRSGNAKWQSFYPGIGVSVTLEGQYPNLRHFIRDIEANKQFLIINSVQLENATGAHASLPPTVPATRGSAQPVGAPPEGELPSPDSKTSLVSLQLDMVKYFRREVADTAAPTPPAAH
jgi:Tfp pilus assembly protein PilO